MGFTIGVLCFLYFVVFILFGIISSRFADF